ncbi:MAG: bifunctional nuclease family protein [Bacteroidota bacterium]
MEKVKLEILGLSPSQAQAGSFALVLGEEFGNRRLPIIIGMFEAQAIAIEIEKILPNRPMTHDLFKQFALKFNFTVVEIQITDIKEGIFYAKIVCSDGHKEIIIDARPSDAIAVGVRFEVPIYTTEVVLDEAGITTSEADQEHLSDEEEEDIVFEERPKKNFSDQLRESTNDELQKMLEEALIHEEYERAAKIRDEMSKRN